MKLIRTVTLARWWSLVFLRTTGLMVAVGIVVALSGRGTCAADLGLELIEVRKIWDAAPHNAFTDLIRFKGRWHCTFREADGHVGGDGKLRVIESTDDGKTWTSAALLAEAGIDLRDPKLSITPDGRLMMIANGALYNGGKTALTRQSCVTFSKDGRKWSVSQRVLQEQEWLWRVTWHQGKAYGATYNLRRNSPNDSPDPTAPNVLLVSSNDGIDWQTVTLLEVPDRANETTLRFLADDTMVALVRREGGDRLGWIGSSKPPYTAWTWKSCGSQLSHPENLSQLGGPNFLQLPDGSLWATTRHRGAAAGKKEDRTTLVKMTLDGLEPKLALPSGGDTSYAGMVLHDGLLWVSYYSSHEGKASIYLAKVRAN